MNSVNQLILEMISHGNVVEGTAALMAQPMLDSLTILNQVLYAGGRADNPMLVSEKNRLMDALPNFEHGLDRRDILHNLGCIALFQDEILEAQQYFRQSIEISPDFLPSWHNLAYAHELMADYGTAVNLYQMVLSYDANYLLSRINHSLLLLATDQEAAGLEALRNLEQNFPANKGVRLYLVRALLTQNNPAHWAEAVDLITQMSDYEAWEPFHEALAYAYYRQGNWDMAQTTFANLLDADPENPYALKGMVRVLAELSNLSEAAIYISRYHALNPTDATQTLVQGLQEAGYAV